MNARHRAIYLIFLSAAAGLGGFLFGFDSIVVSGTIPLIEAQMKLAAHTEGLFVAASLIGCMVSAPIAGMLADKFGRRPNLFAAALCTLIAAAVSLSAPGMTQLMTGRFIGGLGVGVASIVCPLYIAEIAPARLRGRLVSLYQFAITIGICSSLFANAAVVASGTSGWLVALLGGSQWRAMFATQIAPGLAFVLICTLVPESPRWLHRHGSLERARRTLYRVMPDEEAADTLVAIARATTAEAGSRLGYWELLTPQNLRSLELALALATFSELSGITAVFYYGPTILGDAGFALGGALNGFAIIGLVNMAATVIALWLIDRVGRRPLLFWGTIGAIASLISAGVLLSAHSGHPWPLVLSICAFVACFACSLGPIKFVVVSEVFSNAIRARAMAVFIFWAFAGGAFINFVFPIVREHFGAQATFFGCAAILLGQVAYVRWRMPETTGRRLEDVDALWTVVGRKSATRQHCSVGLLDEGPAARTDSRGAD